MKVLAFRGLERQAIEEGVAGDIVAVAGLAEATVADTICDPEAAAPIPAEPIDPATITMTFAINDGPLAGTEGDKVTSRVIRDRLFREAEGNVAIKVKESEGKDSFEVSGRGELQLAVLIETMRREGFELCVGRPRVIFRVEEGSGQRLEPIEEVVIDVDDEFTGAVVEKLGERRGELKDMRPSGGGKTRLVFHAPARALIGYHGEFMTDTRGTGIINRLFHGYAPYKGPIPGRRNGSLISLEQGKAVAYALWYLQERGPLFVDPGQAVYAGMVIGENARGQDLDVNPLKTKQLTNVRASGKDDAILLTPPIRMTLEKAIAYVEDDELVEITPKSIRLRKRLLDIHERRKQAKRAEVA
jgi:GTP-binding protein